MATFDKIKENYLGLCVGAVFALGVFFFDPSYSKCIDVIKAIPQLTTCIFGFLLTLLGIILQGNSPAIEQMQNISNISVFNRFIDYNKRIVVLSFILTLLTLLTGYLDFEWLRNLFFTENSFLAHLVCRMTICLLSFGIVWLVIDLMVFVNLFYQLIKRSK